MKTLTGLDARKLIMDPVHKMIPITELELEIISTPVFQRLRKISQLSAVSLVYPGATHNRFQHSLGTLHVMDRFLYSLKTKNKIKSQGENLQKCDLEDIFKKMRLSALLHDIGHLPFSHTFENLYKEKFNVDHEDLSGYIVCNSEIGGTLKEKQIDPDTIMHIINGDVPMNEDYSKIFELLVPLMNSDADADRMDYLLRDSYFTGVHYGRIDLQRITDFVTIEKNFICFDEHAQDALEDLLYSRFQMYKRVYNHKTAICYDLIYQKLYNYFEKYSDNYDFPFFLPEFENYQKNDPEWFNNELCELTEDEFFRSIRFLINDPKNIVQDKDSAQIKQLFSRIQRRLSIKNCFLYDNLAEIKKNGEKSKKQEICKIEEDFFKKLKSFDTLDSDWSFLRHDPSHPLAIISSIGKITDKEQDPNQIRIYLKENKEVELLQDRPNSIINQLSTHHRVLVAYYHDDEKCRKVIRNLAEEHFKSVI